MTTQQTAPTPPHETTPSRLFFTLAEGCGHPLLTVVVPGVYKGQYHIAGDDLTDVRDQVNSLIALIAAGPDAPPV